MVKSKDIISKGIGRYPKIKNRGINVVRGVKEMKCEKCVQELPRYMFRKVWSGASTGKRLEECSDRTQELYHRRDNCQRYCIDCSRKWVMKNVGKCRGYSRKYRDSIRDETVVRRKEKTLINKEMKGLIYEGATGSGDEVGKFQSAI